jgi:APA family basic amino acid/polyamine antiporter
MLLIAVLTILTTIGIKESMRVNLVLVAVKLFVVLFVIIAGIGFINPANYSPFIPPAEPGGVAVENWYQQPLIQAVLGLEPTAFGIGGIFTGAALVFFAYIGFDVVATTAEEAKNPKRDLPIGIIGSLVICTILYGAVALVITGMVKYNEIDTKAALASAFTSLGKPGYATLISAGAVAGLTTVVLTLMIGAARVVFAMSRDHLLPPVLSKVHPKFKTPYVITIAVGIFAMLVAGLTPIGRLEEMVNIGTLTAFVLVSVGVVILRRTRPDLPRAFKVPGSPVIPILSALICFYLTLNLSLETWFRFLVWMALGFLIYGIYGYRRSRLATGETLAQMSHHDTPRRP